VAWGLLDQFGEDDPMRSRHLRFQVLSQLKAHWARLCHHATTGVAAPTCVAGPATALGQVSGVNGNSDIVERVQRRNPVPGVSSLS